MSAEREDFEDCLVALSTRKPRSVLVRSGLSRVGARLGLEHSGFELLLVYQPRGDDGGLCILVRKAIDKDALMGAEPDMRRAAGDIAMHSLEECVGEFFSG